MTFSSVRTAVLSILVAGTLLSPIRSFAQDPAQDALAEKAFALIREGKYDDAKKAVEDLERVNKTNPRVAVLKELLLSETQPLSENSLAEAAAAGVQNEKDRLCVMAAEGDLWGVRKQLEKGVNADAKDQYGTTALEHAAEAGHSEIVKLLIEKKANVNMPDLRGTTPLMLAVWNGHLETVKVLLEAGADVNLRSASGTTALIIARGKNRGEIAALLEQKGAVE